MNMSNIQNFQNRQGAISYFLSAEQHLKDNLHVFNHIKINSELEDDISLIEDFLQIQNKNFPKKILIPYAGSGYYAVNLAAKNPEDTFVLTCEHEEQKNLLISVCKNYSNIQIILEQPGSLSTLEDKTFDSVLLIEGYSFCYKKGDLLKEISRVIKYGGRFIIIDFTDDQQAKDNICLLENNFGFELEDFEITKLRASQQGFNIIKEKTNFSNQKFQECDPHSNLLKSIQQRDLVSCLFETTQILKPYFAVFEKN